LEELIHESGALIERALGDLLKYDDLNLERFKVLVEFVEYFGTRAQQLAEQADADYWNGLASEADLASRGRLSLSNNTSEIVRQLLAAVNKYIEAGNNATARDMESARQTAFAGAASSLAAKEQYDNQLVGQSCRS
jgi:hypothetical protein